MPVRKRVDKRKQAITNEHESWLHGNDKASGFIKYLPSEELAALWADNAERIVAEHVDLYPGTRPERWWQYDAPRQSAPGWYYDGLLPEPRLRLGGTGTPASDVLAYMPIFSLGLPAVLVTRWQVKYYSGLAVDIHGNPVGGSLAVFDGVAIDESDPPTFESQAAYLDRHALFLPNERKRLKRADFEPESITE